MGFIIREIDFQFDIPDHFIEFQTVWAAFPIVC